MQHTSSYNIPVLTTERLTLRQLQLTDAQEIFLLRSDAAINKYLNRQLCHNIDEAIGFINKITENNALYWAITFSNKNVLLGTICLFDFDAENNSCEIGFELLTNLQGQGIMMEAAKKVIAYAFNTIEVKKIKAFTHEHNAASVKLLQKLFFNRLNEADEISAGLICFVAVPGA